MGRAFLFSDSIEIKKQQGFVFINSVEHAEDVLRGTVPHFCLFLYKERCCEPNSNEVFIRLPRVQGCSALLSFLNSSGIKVYTQLVSLNISKESRELLNFLNMDMGLPVVIAGTDGNKGICNTVCCLLQDYYSLNHLV